MEISVYQNVVFVLSLCSGWIVVILFFALLFLLKIKEKDEQNLFMWDKSANLDVFAFKI